MGDVLNIVLAIVSIGATVVVGAIWGRRGKRDLDQRFDALDRLLIRAIGLLSKSDPRGAAQIVHQKEQLSAAAPTLRTTRIGSPGMVTDGDRCPRCVGGAFRWNRWAPGPFGSFTAWYKCQKCDYELPNNEIFEG
jgi:hypothetical protein